MVTKRLVTSSVTSETPLLTAVLTVNRGVVTLAVTQKQGAHRNATSRNRMQQLVSGELVAELVRFQLWFQ